MERTAGPPFGEKGPPTDAQFNIRRSGLFINQIINIHSANERRTKSESADDVVVGEISDGLTAKCEVGGGGT